MTLIRSVVVFIILAIFTSTIADAQLRRLRERAKERAEERLEEKAEQAVDRQVDKAVDALWEQSEDAFIGMLESALPKSKTTVDEEAGVVTQEGKDDLKLKDNESGPTDAEFVSYTNVSIFKLPGQFQALADRFGNARLEEFYQHGSKRYEGSDESGVTLDAEDLSYIVYDHTNSQYWTASFEEMIEGAGEALEGVQPTVEAVEQSADQPELEMTVSTSFQERGSSRVRGLDAQNYTVIVSVTPRDPEIAAQQGTTHAVSMIATADEFGGSATLEAYETEFGESILEFMEDSDINDSINLAAFNDSQLMEAVEKVGEELSRIEGRPVETVTYVVKTQAGVNVDADALENGSPSDSQAVLFQMKTFMTNLSTEPFDLSLLGDRGYSRIESPISQYLDGGNE